MDPGAAVGLCVRSIKVCPGTTFCKRGLQNSVAVGSNWTAYIMEKNYLIN